MHYISELLYHHDCVIIPDLGGFIANYRPTEIHPINNTFSPPSKAIIFNQNIKTNDGLLIHHIATSEKITYDEAKKKLENYVHKINETLNNGGNISIINIGDLKRNKEGNILFEHESKVNFLNESYGLYEFTPTVILSKQKLIKHPSKQQNVRKLAVSGMKWAAVLLPLLFIAFLLKMNSEYLNSLNRQITKYFEPPAVESTFENQTSQAGFVPIKSENNELKHTKEIKTPPKTPNTDKPIEETTAEKEENNVRLSETDLLVYQKKYHIIVGAFRVKSNALTLNKKLISQNFDSRIIDITHSGLYRLSIHSYYTKDEAFKALRQIRSSTYSNAWMMKRTDIPENVVEFI